MAFRNGEIRETNSQEGRVFRDLPLHFSIVWIVASNFTLSYCVEGLWKTSRHIWSLSGRIFSHQFEMASLVVVVCDFFPFLFLLSLFCHTPLPSTTKWEVVERGKRFSIFPFGLLSLLFRVPIYSRILLSFSKESSICFFQPNITKGFRFRLRGERGGQGKMTAKGNRTNRVYEFGVIQMKIDRKNKILTRIQSSSIHFLLLFLIFYYICLLFRFSSPFLRLSQIESKTLVPEVEKTRSSVLNRCRTTNCPRVRVPPLFPPPHPCFPFPSTSLSSHRFHPFRIWEEFRRWQTYS